MRKTIFLLLMCITIAKIESKVGDVLMSATRSVCLLYVFGGNSNVSETCDDRLNALCSDTSKMNTMVDAWGKFPFPGLQFASPMDYGNFDQCMSATYNHGGNRILAEHCAVGVVIPDMFDDGDDITFFALGVCRPYGCNSSDYNAILASVIDLPLFQDMFCQTAETGREFTAVDIVTTMIFGICIALMIICSMYDIYLSKKKLKPSNQLYLAFSVVTNGKKLFQITKRTDSKEQIEIFHGLKTISMMWVIAGHGFTGWPLLAVSNARDVEEWQTRGYAVYITAARLAVDTFFYISGFLLAYQYLKQRPKPVMAHVRTIPQLYLHRYLRLTPALLMTFLFTISLMRHIGDGPMWGYAVERVRAPCLEFWWSFFLYIQNYVNFRDEELCLIPTWYLSADMQMFLLSPFIIIPIAFFLKKPSGFKNSLIEMAVLCVVFIALPMAINLAIPEYDNQYDTHSRLINYFVGITLGIFMRTKQDKPFLYMVNRENLPFANILLWMLTLGGMLAIVMCHHEVENNHGHTSQSVFDALMRPAWCIGLSWIIYACHHGYGGIVNSILTIPIFQILGKLTYCMYLLHLLVMLRFLGTTRNRVFFSDYITFYQFCGHYLITVVVSIFWTLAFESPLIIIEKVVFAAGHTKKTKEDEPTRNGIEEGSYRRENGLE